ncbi:hypothetical protein RUND412_002478 [Rhizina undulata]
MGGLPAEILQDIVGHLSGDDLDSVRLVNHEFSAAANVFKYRALRVSVSRKGLDHLLYVSQQLALANCVREIIYPWGYLPSLAQPSSREFLRSQRENRPIPELVAILRMARHFVKWHNHKIYTRQAELEDSGECVAALEAALPRMPHIRFLQPSFSPNFDSFLDKIDEWRGTLTSSNGGDNIGMDWDKSGGCNVYPYSTEDCDARAAKHVFDLIDISYRVGLKLNGIGSSITGKSPIFRLQFFSDSSGILQNCVPLIENLTSLSLSLQEAPSYIDVEGFKKTFTGGRLHKFLCSATNLRVLSLGISFCPSLADECLFSLVDVFGDVRIWKYLHTLRFWTDIIPINVKDLVDFLRRHSETLKELSLDLTTLFGGTCRDVLDFIKGQLHLTKFKPNFSDEIEWYPRMPFSDTDMDRMIAYVLHGGPGFPPTEIELEEELNSEEAGLKALGESEAHEDYLSQNVWELM